MNDRTPKGHIAETKSALEDLVRVQMAAEKAYAAAIEAVGDSPIAVRLVELKTGVSSDADSVRNLLARLHDQEEVTSGGTMATVASGMLKVAALFGESATTKSLQLAEVALGGFMEDIADDQLMPMARTELVDILIPASKRRVAALEELG